MIRKYLITIVALLTSLMTAAAADFSGTWKGVLTPENRDPGSALVMLTQTGDVVTGTGGQDQGDRYEIRNGKVTGDTVTFDIQTGETVMRFVLKLEGDTLKGEVTRERDGRLQKATLDLKRDKS
jgi:hypothetical protein